MRDGKTRKLEVATMRISRLKMLPLAVVIADLSEQVGVPIELSPAVDPAILQGHFGNYLDFLGFHPRAWDILNAVTWSMFSSPGRPAVLVPILEKERIRLVTAEEAEAHWTALARRVRSGSRRRVLGVRATRALQIPGRSPDSCSTRDLASREDESGIAKAR